MKNTQVRRENKIKSTHITITKNPRSNISILKIVPHFLNYQTTHTKKMCHLSYITTSTSQKLNLFHYPHHKYPRTQAPNPHNRKFSPILSATKQPHQFFFLKSLKAARRRSPQALSRPSRSGAPRAALPWSPKPSLTARASHGGCWLGRGTVRPGGGSSAARIDFDDWVFSGVCWGFMVWNLWILVW